MAAENDDQQRQVPAVRGAASMRPRRMAAENLAPLRAEPDRPDGFNEAAAHGRGKRGPRGAVWCAVPEGGFNEAAAHGRGKRRAPVVGGGGRSASMRPRRMAAENGRLTKDMSSLTPGFNEAAAHGRGKRRSGCSTPSSASSFNEAAAHGRGKRPRPLRQIPGRRASMRPRRMAAENITHTHDTHSDTHASMRPRRMAAENEGLQGMVRLPEAVASMRPRRMAAENLVVTAAVAGAAGLQ